MMTKLVAEVSIDGVSRRDILFVHNVHPEPEASGMNSVLAGLRLHPKKLADAASDYLITLLGSELAGEGGDVQHAPSKPYRIPVLGTAEE